MGTCQKNAARGNGVASKRLGLSQTLGSGCFYSGMADSLSTSKVLGSMLGTINMTVVF